MSKGMFEKKGQHVYKTVGGKSLVLLLALVLVVGGMIGGTVAWLTANTDEVKNVFTTSDIKVELKEHEYDEEDDKLTNIETTKGVENYQMVPGWTIPKDPWVTVSADSEDCYLFIKVQENGGNVTVDSKEYSFDDFIVYDIQTGNEDSGKWIALGNGYPGVYYKKIDTLQEKNTKHYILAGGTYTDADNNSYTWDGNAVLTKPEVTKDMMEAVKSNPPKLTFTAYAVQLYQSNGVEFTVTDAWAKVAPAPANPGN